MITGKWGSGKSYYIKGLAKELNDNKKEYLCVISLFGIDSVANLIKLVKERYIDANSNGFTRMVRKVGKTAQTALNTAGDIANIATGGNPVVAGVKTGVSSVLSIDFFDFISVKNYIGSGKSKRKFVLVFDDLERCKVNMIDLLGAINEYCENRNIKTIILADENKILENEVSLKKVNWKEDEKEKEISITEQPKSADNYSEFKEKVIFQTLEFEVPYSDIIDAMISAYDESISGYVIFLHCNADIIKQVFGESGYNNLRSIKAILTNFERVYSAIQKAGVPNEFTPKILCDFAIKHFEAKPKGQHNEENRDYRNILKGFKEDAQNSNQSNIKYSSERINIYSLQQWIETGRYDEEAVISELKNIYNPKQITDKNKVLHWAVFDLDYSTTVKGLQDALNDAYEGNLCGRDYVGLIDRLQYYRYHKIPIDFVDYGKLSKGIDKYEERLKKGGINEENNIFVPNNIVKQANEDTISLLEKLEYIEDNCAAWEAKFKFIRAIQSKERRFYALDVHWLEAFDDELLAVFIKEYKEADNAQKRDMSHYLLTLDFIYELGFRNKNNKIGRQKKISALNTSIVNFEKLQDDVKNQIEKESDIITKMILNEFSDNILMRIQQLKEALDKIKNNNGASN